MGLDVYTPAYSRLRESDEYRRIRSRYDAWASRSTVSRQCWTDEDVREYEAITGVKDRMEHRAGTFRHRAPFSSKVGPMVALEQETCSMAELTHREVGQYLLEWKCYLREQVHRGKHLEQYVNGFGELVLSPFDLEVERFKSWCIVYRLGEGCYIL